MKIHQHTLGILFGLFEPINKCSITPPGWQICQFGDSVDKLMKSGLTDQRCRRRQLEARGSHKCVFDTKNPKHAIYYVSQLESKRVLMTCKVRIEFKCQSVNAESSSVPFNVTLMRPAVTVMSLALGLNSRSCRTQKMTKLHFECQQRSATCCNSISFFKWPPQMLFYLSKFNRFIHICNESDDQMCVITVRLAFFFLFFFCSNLGI